MSEKKKGHGTRKHFQILLSEHRGNLFIQMMKEKGIKPTNWLREKFMLSLRKKHLKTSTWKLNKKTKLNGKK